LVYSGAIIQQIGHIKTRRGAALTPNLASPFNQAVKIIAGRSFLVYTLHRSQRFSSVIAIPTFSARGARGLKKWTLANCARGEKGALSAPIRQLHIYKAAVPRHLLHDLCSSCGPISGKSWGKSSACFKTRVLGLICEKSCIMGAHKWAFRAAQKKAPLGIVRAPAKDLAKLMGRHAHRQKIV
jgi:hypothetical protein